MSLAGSSDDQVLSISRRILKLRHPRTKNTHRLTSREREVLQLVAEGNANKQVAAELKISIRTVEKHRQALMDKLGIDETAGLTRYAISAGLIESRVQITIF